jgi:hypothetical protein
MQNDNVDASWFQVCQTDKWSLGTTVCFPELLLQCLLIPSPNEIVLVSSTRREQPSSCSNLLSQTFWNLLTVLHSRKVEIFLEIRKE